jgi:hypothetical protein
VFRDGHLGLVTEVAPVIGGFLASDAGSGRAG